MKCSYCAVNIHLQIPDVKREQFIVQNKVPQIFNSNILNVCCVQCPACSEVHVFFDINACAHGRADSFLESSIKVWPHVDVSRICPREVIERSPEIANDFNEACLVLTLSVRASAALSRRCLQAILRNNNLDMGRLRTLDQEIEYVQNNTNIPNYITSQLGDLRRIGNYAAHPPHAGVIVDQQELSEAEFCLDVLESLFDFYYVQPARATRIQNVNEDRAARDRAARNPQN